ncbi:hypothetical protein N9X24_03285 [Rickettsiales bacterium]|nr:hypothetical protein [Rickettsiales bacterium]
MINIEILNKITIKAGKIAMTYYNQNYDIKTKDDNSPVTAADFAVNDYIISSLRQIYPDIAIISEENSYESNLKATKERQIFIIDPIDGTRAFINKKSQFTINIGYVQDGKFVLGFIYAPILDILYYSDHNKSYKLQNNKLQILQNKDNDFKNGIIQTSSMGRTENIKIAEEFKNLQIKKIIQSSSSYKFCLIAEAVADFYPRRGNMRIWDVAAAFGILKFLDYQFLDLSRNKITFDRMIDDFLIPDFNLFRSQEILNHFDNILIS